MKMRADVENGLSDSLGVESDSLGAESDSPWCGSDSHVSGSVSSGRVERPGVCGALQLLGNWRVS